MDLCFLVFADICLSPMDLKQVNFEHVYGTIYTAEYNDFEVRIIAGDHLIIIDREKSPQVCIDKICAVYHQYCDKNDNQQWCRYQIQRTDRLESITIIAQSNQGKLPPDWRQNLAIVYGSNLEHKKGLQNFSQLSTVKQFPRSKTKRTRE